MKLNMDIVKTMWTIASVVFLLLGIYAGFFDQSYAMAVALIAQSVAFSAKADAIRLTP